jgi:LmbE family N-acetylglucosaminyl deacetylase
MHRIDLLPVAASPNKRILALGAHCDDIEIGCGGTMLRLAAERPSHRSALLLDTGFL